MNRNGSKPGHKTRRANAVKALHVNLTWLTKNAPQARRELDNVIDGEGSHKLTRRQLDSLSNLLHAVYRAHRSPTHE